VKFLNYNAVNLETTTYVNSSRCFIPTEIIKNNEKVFIYYQIKLQLKKTPYQYSDSYKFIKKLISLNTKRGYKLKSVQIYSNVLDYIYSYFESFDASLESEYPTYHSFFEFSRNFPQEFYKPDFLVRYIHLYLELIFLLKRVKPKKKLKKKKNIPKTLISYIPNHSRANITLRIINSYVNNSNTYNNVIRIGNALMYLVLAGKNSFLYKKKLSMYNKLLEKKKFY